MYLITAFALFISIGQTYGSPCQDLSGVWRNQLGSNMTVTMVGSNRFTGRYNTSVESSKGASRISSNISGVVQAAQDGSVVGFNVLWNRGASLTVWVGQCMVCGGQETIFTTWVLRSLMPPSKRWMTTRINQDTFHRVAEGAPQSPELPEEECNANSDLSGNWESSTGDAIDFTCIKDSGCVEGLFHDSPPQHDRSDPHLYGVRDGNETFTAMGLVRASNYKIRGWTGHIHNPAENRKHLESSWLEHTFYGSCTNPREQVSYGMDDYVHTQSGDHTSDT